MFVRYLSIFIHIIDHYSRHFFFFPIHPTTPHPRECLSNQSSGENIPLKTRLWNLLDSLPLSTSPSTLFTFTFPGLRPSTPFRLLTAPSTGLGPETCKSLYPLSTTVVQGSRESHLQEEGAVPSVSGPHEFFMSTTLRRHL